VARTKRFANGKTLPQAEFISAEEVKSVRGVPRKMLRHFVGTSSLRVYR
jgi:hypothetical protein